MRLDVALLRRALARNPDDARLRSHLAFTLILVGKPDEAEALCRETVRLQPGLFDGHHRLAAALAAQGRFDEALASNARALALRRNHPEARVCRALWRLQTGDFARGWPEYEWRWRIDGVRPRRFRTPRWTGTALTGRSLLIHAEQALGDTIQFIRYVPLVRRRGGRVIVESQPELVPLLRGCAGIDRVVARGLPAPACDFQVPLLSLPGVLRTSLHTVPADIPYLFADRDLVERWRQRLGDITGLRIGIAWQGRPTSPGDALRSIPLSHFAPLAEVEGVRLYGLQKGRGREQIRSATQIFPLTNLGGRLDTTTGAFVETAAVMKNLDLIVTSDTAIAHLAGALGVRVWVALPIGADWRWLRDRDDSPWYPTMRLFRQRQLHDWKDVFERMALELRRSPAPPAKIQRAPRATICILTYGDHLPYFRRCLDSVLRHTPAGQIELRLGFNAAAGSLEYARQRLGLHTPARDEHLRDGVRRASYVTDNGMTVRLWSSPVNLYKEPMARLMYHDVPLGTDYAIWFDDDSFVERGWWSALCPLLDRRVDYIGQSWWVDYLPGQTAMIKAQPWYRGVPFQSRSGRAGVRFMTGGFMAVRAQRLREADFPDTRRPWKGDTLTQYGGDTLLGEIARQNGWPRAIHAAHIKINVDLRGRHPAPRRGGTGRQFGSDVDVVIA